MKTQRSSAGKRGFTLMELMVAMAITTIIVTVLVSITSIALETWNRSRAELRASRQAKAMLDVMGRDFESLVIRRGNNDEWLSALATVGSVGDARLESTNSCELIFFTAVTDRYNGDLGTNSTTDKGGDVSCVSYSLDYKDPMDGGNTDFKTFVLNRLVVNPDDTFDDLLGKDDLDTEFASYKSELKQPQNFVCENLFQFSVTFHVQVSKKDSNGVITSVETVPVTIGQSGAGQMTKEFRINGSGIDAEVTGGAATADEIKGGRIVAVEISTTVISDFGIEQMKRRSMSESQKSDFLAQNSYQFTKLVQLPSM
ncbi:MAG: prepilin-type N-terminal cleavage/methylation domain-containing protein [Verrucomicrobiaceae bacterium]|nr:MAG: prepilin-type N-terminal cleavage/methylation domain-containing protein [Verrucomicrobiaceae bacterium]